MTKLKSRASSPAEIVRIASSVAPELPPARMPAAPPPEPAEPDKPAMLSVRLMDSTITAVARAAKERGITQRQLIARALAAEGIQVAPADMEDRAPPRRRA